MYVHIYIYIYIYMYFKIWLIILLHLFARCSANGHPQHALSPTPLLLDISFSKDFPFATGAQCFCASSRG